ncbi:MAG: hypothetical protein Q3990_07365 [Desulfovibrionaceae bacterium]|nr:hypothetical protein [Desulfovibrionaceae bacterium]
MGTIDPFMTILIKAEDRFAPCDSIFVKPRGEQEEWKANKEALWDIKNADVAYFFDWLETRHGLVPYDYIRRSCFAPYELYEAVKKSFMYDITVETNEPVEDFGDPGSYFDDMPDAIY